VKTADAGLLLADTITELLLPWSRFIPDGLAGIGYGSEHLDKLVLGTLPQVGVM
jgi:hypothetical protein